MHPGRILDNLINIPVKLSTITSSNSVDILNVRPGLGIQLAMIYGISPVGDYARATEVYEQGDFLALQDAIDDGFDAGFVWSELPSSSGQAAFRAQTSNVLAYAKLIPKFNPSLQGAACRRPTIHVQIQDTASRQVWMS
ncbi:hypothetical protein CLAFUW4_09413 [Fulvia fulva]|uniref:Uncharacterized protein n=1 Tax=Passalora fulva TaxID=5499 RepID=A0A9Q8UTN8_PASFU|nr:uncharacterized protein CLAFUR5_09510 [Fulvia fulva]KAK4613557.1 hypothetical protein CLAFUR4_09419 [Fulvia fulva]KAK4615182.1 hypothetical protein CLAFUR0_09410 [Fulvia fulva]UJO22119.1 hypothetical protein CLAFUR5_09510 [Fulvia fulva]WPV20792.1 hypothetical protein CLAFUW4_09413 [Fulvia fulva]WPV35372.1 hypothetical protein CLAFUW7_09414 [Fulvia fulva]